MQLQPLYNHINRFITLTPEEELLLASKIKVKKYLKNQFVVQNGDVCRLESFVLSGALKTYFIDEEGHEHIVALSVENWWVADMDSFINRMPAELNVQCVEPSVLVQISYEDLQYLYITIPKLERFFRLIIQNGFVAAQKRIISNHSLPAKDRYLSFAQKYPAIEQRFPQYMIASYLGITKEFLSKIRQQLQYK